MFQTIPLRARLRVNLNLIIQSKEALFLHLLHIVLNRNAAKARKLDIVHGPVQLDMAAGLNLPRSLFDSLCIQEVDGYSTKIVTWSANSKLYHSDSLSCEKKLTAKLILFAASVKKPPQTALRLPRHRRQLVKVGKLICSHYVFSQLCFEVAGDQSQKLKPLNMF